MNLTLSRSGMLAQSISAITLIGSASVHAQATVEEIVVTAQRRAEAIEDVPLAVSAFSGEFTREVNLDDVKDLIVFTPGITGNSKDSFIDTISVRGILTNDFGVGGDPSVGFFKNDLYQGRNGAVVTSLYDIERAEVLRGPQGFLFGRNSIGGAVSVFTTRPSFDAVGGYIEADVGERNHMVLEGAVNVPFSDTLALRVAGYHSEEDGYVDNVFFPEADELIEHDKDGVRATLRFNNDRVDANFMVEHEDRQQSGSIYRATETGESWATLQALFPGLDVRGNGRDADSDLGLGQADDAEILALELSVDVDLGWASLQSTTGYKDHEYFYAEDFDGTPLRINDYSQDQEGTYFEQELRLVSQGDDPLSWYAGVSYYQEEIDVLFAQGSSEEVMCNYYLSYYGFTNCTDYFAYYGYVFTPNPEGLVERNRVRGDYEGWAAYVDLTYAFSDRLDASLGVRYTYDEKQFALAALPIKSQLGPFFALGFTTVGFLEDTRDWDAVTPRFLVRYQPNDEWMVFGSVTRGYKSGGFGSFAIRPEIPFGVGIGLTPADGFLPGLFDPEKVWSYEVGAKSEVLDGRMRLGLNAYFYDYKDLQVTVPGQGGGIIVDNVGQVDGWGSEGTVQAVLGRYFDLYFAIAYADSEVTGAEALCDGTDACDGEGLSHLPEWSGSAVLGFHYPWGNGEVTAGLEAYGQTEIFGDLIPAEATRMDGYVDFTLRAGYASNDGWSVTAYIENLTDELYYDGISGDGGIIPPHFFGPSRPRTVGVILSYDFQ